MLTKILTVSFYLLFFFTPLFWLPSTYELFEYNKMMVIYFLTIIITSSWLVKMIKEKRLILNSTPLDLPLLLFLGANILSTIFSIDRHTSIWGYYSRSNGGLLSILSYIILYYALVSNFDKSYVFRFLKAAIFGGVVVALYAIPEHFGVSPSCIILTGEATASCWVQDVQARVFATLGQPNWLAAYLATLIFPTLYFLLTATKRSLYILHFTFLIIFYLAFTFTYSRGATIGLLAGLIVFLLLQLRAWWQTIFELIINFITQQTIPTSHPRGEIFLPANWKLLSTALLSFIIINLIFGSALTDFKLLSKFSPPPRPSLTETAAKPMGTQLESGGTESGKIRFIVWQGALEIFKHYPIFGSGVETFAYSYYNFRPQAHNLVSEWDFLYNKAHNEYLNYLATTGLVGFLSYLAIILTFIIWSVRRIYNLQLTMYKEKNNFTLYILHCTLLASYASYLVQNLFGFSVVVIALFFYLFPAIVFIATDSTKPFTSSKFYILHCTLYITLYRRFFYSGFTQIVVLIIASFLLLTWLNNYRADFTFAQGHKENEAGNAGLAFNLLSEAVKLNPREPFYQSELGYATAASATALAEEDATISAVLKDQAEEKTAKVLAQNPKNVSYFRTAVRTYYLLSGLDKNFTDKTLQTLDQAISLAPTDPKLTYNKALILEGVGQKSEAALELEKTVRLKANYHEALYTLGVLYFDQGRKEEAIKQMEAILVFIPNEPGALEKLKEWGQ